MPTHTPLKASRYEICPTLKSLRPIKPSPSSSSLRNSRRTSAAVFALSCGSTTQCVVDTDGLRCLRFRPVTVPGASLFEPTGVTLTALRDHSKYHFFSWFHATLAILCLISFTYLIPERLPQLLCELGLGIIPFPGVSRAEQEQLPVRHAAFSVEPVTVTRSRSIGQGKMTPF